MQLIEVINRLEKEFKISISDFEFYNRYRLLSVDYDDELLDSIFKEIPYITKDLFLFPKNELYDINVQVLNKEFILLKIHDFMTIKYIIELIINIRNLDKNIPYDLCCEGFIIYDIKKTAFYHNIRKKSCSISLHDNILYG